MNLRYQRIAVAALAALAISGGAALAGSLDAPSMGVARSDKPSTVRLEVTAGETGASGGFEVQWMKKVDYDARGGWPTEYDHAVVTCEFSGIPTWTVEGAGSYVLGSLESQMVELGQLFDETGVASTYTHELESFTDYVVRVRAIGAGGDSDSPYGETLSIRTGLRRENCTFTQGFWKNHPEVWPVVGLTIAGHFYTASELLDIFNEPARGNGLLILAHQLIAAKLNIENGADPTAASASIAAAEALIGALIIPPVGGGFLDPDDVSALTGALDLYNNGLSGPPHCGTVPATEKTWGQVKALYRN
ncbi:MAG: hypothetical protein ACREOU_00735 [Candidatus Eiseniibacteriota bacterium]